MTCLEHLIENGLHCVGDFGRDDFTQGRQQVTATQDCDAKMGKGAKL